MVKTLSVFRNFSIRNVVITIVVMIFGVQLISLLLNTFFSSIPIFKTGNLLFIISVLLTAITLVNIVFSREFNKNDFLAIFIMVGITVSIYFFLPKILPELFSIFGSSALESAQGLASTLGF